MTDSSSGSSESRYTTIETSESELHLSSDIAKKENASGIIISALGESPLQVVLEAYDDLKRVLYLLDAGYAFNRIVSRI